VSDPSKPADENKDPRVEAAIRDYLERIDRGEEVDREEFVSRYREVANAVRSFIEAEEELRELPADAPALNEHSHSAIP
jgi:hypothetical protein